jgi:hydroxymethylpyrimidine/phosphomethylpyrimidine kinase
MLATAAIVRAVAEGLAVQRTQGKLAHLVVDTVMVSKSGDELLTRDATSTLIEAVLPLATMITPNLPEAGVLLRSSPPDSLRDMQRAAERLRRLLPDSGQCWVLLKGGHLPGDAVDLLHDGDRMIEFCAPRINTRNTHGTGCSLSAAIAALLPRTDVPDAVGQAKRWLTQAISRSGELTVGQGHGPVHHFHQLWSR